MSSDISTTQIGSGAEDLVFTTASCLAPDNTAFFSLW